MDEIKVTINNNNDKKAIRLPKEIIETKSRVLLSIVILC